MAVDLSSKNEADAAFLLQIVEHIAHPIFVKDRSFAFVLLNKAFCDLVGYSPAEMLAKSDYDFFPKEEADFFRRKDIEMFSTESQVVIEEEPITDASGQRHVLATTKVPLRAPSGEITHLVGIIHDITRMKAAEEALRRSNEDLERRVQERTAALADAQQDLARKERLTVLGQLAGGVAHQVRNPLGAIKNAAHILERVVRAESSPEAAEALAVIHEEVRNANQIVSDLLGYARVRPPVRRATEVEGLLAQAIGAQIVPSDVHVVRELPTLPRVAVDPDQVQGALYNIMRNALEAMPNGGTLSLAARREGNEVVISVKDTGAGIPEAIRSRLFEPLITTKSTGLGLGLVTARSLIENQGGRIDCETSATGTTFRVRLPMDETDDRESHVA